jgi:DNA modification methylase
MITLIVFNLGIKPIMNDRIQLFNNDCLNVLKQFNENSIDSIVTDPPYGISFMGKKWDYDVPSVGIWQECLRVLKPGGHLLSFASTRTQHRMATRIEDAGFEIRDMIAWVYGSGFPKSHNLKGEHEGFGTALKPALEPITMARKPLYDELTVLENCKKWNTGPININGCRIPYEKNDDIFAKHPYGHGGNKTGGDLFRGKNTSARGNQVSEHGRWPANLIHDGDQTILDLFPESQGGAFPKGEINRKNKQTVNFGTPSFNEERTSFGKGSASRFFYCAKASQKEKNEGSTNGNKHPTVKPLELMRYLCRLATPINGTILDPFMGSGTTGKAAILEGFNFIGIERDNDSFITAKERIDFVLSSANQ